MEGFEALPTSVIERGTMSPLSVDRQLRAGPLALRYADGDLHAIELGGRPVLQRLYAAVRDQNWGTVAPVISGLQIDAGGDAFHITYDATHQQGPIDFRWRATIVGDAQGRISFTLDGRAHSTFLRNRIGLCVLHPIQCAGTPALIEHTNGVRQDAMFPTLVVGEQPVPPFSEMAALRHQIAPGVWAEVRFSGEVFEMEDQRNWSDASFKIFGTPLRLPFPVEVVEGSAIRQSVMLTLRIEGERAGPSKRTQPAEAPVSDRGVTITLAADPPIGALPRLGVGIARHGQALDDMAIARLRHLQLSHLRAELRLHDRHAPAELTRAAHESAAIGLPLEIALFLSDDAEAELRQLRASLEQEQPRVTHWAVFPAVGRVSSPALVALARALLGPYDPGAAFGGGSDSDYIFLSQARPPMEGLDFVTYALNPQVHAFDERSIMQTPAAHIPLVGTARELSGGLPVVVGPVTLRPRFNPYATAATVDPAGELPAWADPRQMSLFAAAWTLASIAHHAEAGVASATYYETSGWGGVLERAEGSPLPQRFRSLPGAAFPLYHVLADLGEMRGAALLALRSSDPGRVYGMALRAEGRTLLLLANLTAETQAVTVRGARVQARVRVLDSASALEAMLAPERYRERAGDAATGSGDSIELQLGAYALARIDL